MSVKTSIIFIYCFFLSMLILQPSGGIAQEKNFYTLSGSIKAALDNNWMLKAKKEKIDQAEHFKKQARSEFLPKLSTSYGYSRLSEPGAFRSSLAGGEKVTVSAKDNYQWKCSITQPLFTGFALVSSYELAKLGIDQSEMIVGLEKLDLVLKVKEAYFNILIADKAVEVAEKAVESLTSNVNVSRSFYKVGMIPINDLLKVEVELANAKQNLVKVRNTARLARSAFNTILAVPVLSPLNVEDILVHNPEQGNLEDYIKQALENRPEIKLVDISILQTDQQIRLSKSENYPEVAFTYDYIKAGDDPDVSGSPFHDAGKWEAVIGLTWTFWEWGKTHYSVKEQESMKKELMQTRLALEDNIRLELKEAMLNLETAEENIPTTQKAVEQGEENLRVNEERYKAQVTTITEVLDAQTLLTQARVNYFKALYDHNLAKARLQRALGTY